MPGLEFVLTHSVFLDEPNLGKLHFFEIWILLETRKFPGENQIKSLLDFDLFSSAFKDLLITKDKIHVSDRKKNEQMLRPQM